MPTRRPVRVAVAVIINDRRVVIARRPPHVPLGGLWEFPGGKIEPGETPEAAAVREVQEELAVTVAAVGRLGVITHDYAHASVVLTPVVCRLVSGTLRAVHCSECRWAEATELASYPFPAANGPLLADVRAALQMHATDDIL